MDKEGNEITLVDIMGSAPGMVCDEVETRLQVERLRELMEKCLSKREKLVINLRYGLTQAHASLRGRWPKYSIFPALTYPGLKKRRWKNCAGNLKNQGGNPYRQRRSIIPWSAAVCGKLTDEPSMEPFGC